jgi:hypothetical protein
MPTDNELTSGVVLTAEDVAEHTGIKPDDLYDLLAQRRADYEVEHPDADEDEIPLTRRDEICAELGIGVTDFHDLKTRLQLGQVDGAAELTIVGRYLPGRGGWGYKVSGSPGGADSRWYRIARQKNVLGRGRVSYAICQTMEAAASADPGVSPELLARIRNQTFTQRRVVEDMERLLAELEK